MLASTVQFSRYGRESAPVRRVPDVSDVGPFVAGSVPPAATTLRSSRRDPKVGATDVPAAGPNLQDPTACQAPGPAPDPVHARSRPEQYWGRRTAPSATIDVPPMSATVGRSPTSWLWTPAGDELAADARCSLERR